MAIHYRFIYLIWKIYKQFILRKRENIQNICFSIKTKKQQLASLSDYWFYVYDTFNYIFLFRTYILEFSEHIYSNFIDFPTMDRAIFLGNDMSISQNLDYVLLIRKTSYLRNSLINIIVF